LSIQYSDSGWEVSVVVVVTIKRSRHYPRIRR